jgi:hypothetical protein
VVIRAWLLLLSASSNSQPPKAKEHDGLHLAGAVRESELTCAVPPSFAALPSHGMTSLVFVPPMTHEGFLDNAEFSLEPYSTVFASAVKTADSLATVNQSITHYR